MAMVRRAVAACVLAPSRSFGLGGRCPPSGGSARSSRRTAHGGVTCGDDRDGAAWRGAGGERATRGRGEDRRASSRRRRRSGGKEVCGKRPGRCERRRRSCGLDEKTAGGSGFAASAGRWFNRDVAVRAEDPPRAPRRRQSGAAAVTRRRSRTPSKSAHEPVPPWMGTMVSTSSPGAPRCGRGPGARVRRVGQRPAGARRREQSASTSSFSVGKYAISIPAAWARPWTLCSSTSRVESPRTYFSRSVSKM